MPGGWPVESRRVTQSLPAYWLQPGCVNVYIGFTPGPHATSPSDRVFDRREVTRADLLFQDQAGHSRPRLRAGDGHDDDGLRLQRRRQTPEAKGASVDCAKFEQYGDLKGKTVSVYTSIVTPEDKPHIDSYKPFEECTGATIKYEGDKEFEAQIPSAIEAGNPPDIAFVPQPGSAAHLVAHSRTRSSPRRQRSSTNVDEYCDPDVEGVRHGRRQVLRRSAGRQRQVVRLVLAVEFKDNG